MVNVLVMAKAPVPGRVKTRLCPPCTPAEAAALARAALCDTLDAALGSGADGVTLALDGEAGPWCPPGIEVIPQRGDGFDQRLTAAWSDLGGPGIQIGMDTPQVTSGDLDRALATLARPGCDAVLGHAEDGGWWLIGLHRPHPEAFAGIEMSTARTGHLQRRRLDRLGLRVGEVPSMVDVDTAADAVAVAAAAPGSRFGALVAELDLAGRLEVAPGGRTDPR